MIKCLQNGGNLMDNNELIVDNLSKEITELVIKSREKLKDETVGLNVVATINYKAGVTNCERTFNKLWKEHMED